MNRRRPFLFPARGNPAEAHLEVTTIVVVVIDIYLYDYYVRQWSFCSDRWPLAVKGEGILHRRVVDVHS